MVTCLKSTENSVNLYFLASRQGQKFDVVDRTARADSVCLKIFYKLPVGDDVTIVIMILININQDFLRLIKIF